MKVEVVVLGSPSLIVTYGLCGHKAALNLTEPKHEQEEEEDQDGNWFLTPSQP